MNNILNLFKPEAIGVSVKENQDPVPAFIDKLSSGEDLKIKIQTNNDNVIMKLVGHNLKSVTDDDDGRITTFNNQIYIKIHFNIYKNTKI